MLGTETRQQLPTLCGRLSLMLAHLLKRILAEHARDPRFVAGFIHEAKIGVHLNHPNIVQVYDLGKVGNTWYIAMEHLHGRDLTRLVKTLRAGDRRLPVPVANILRPPLVRGLG